MIFLYYLLKSNSSKTYQAPLKRHIFDFLTELRGTWTPFPSFWLNTSPQAWREKPLSRHQNFWTTLGLGQSRICCCGTQSQRPCPIVQRSGMVFVQLESLFKNLHFHWFVILKKQIYYLGLNQVTTFSINCTKSSLLLIDDPGHVNRAWVQHVN